MSATPDPSRAVTVPVPLADIEAAAREATPGPWTTPDVSAVWGDGRWVLTDASYEDAAHIAAVDPPTVLALCEALRIAVEGLERIGEPSCPEMRLSPVERLETARSALAAVRELVDLGGDDG